MPAPKRGPKRKPADLAAVVPVATGGWARPAHLKDDAAKAWDHVVSLLRTSGNLARTDPSLVECYAVQFGLLRKAQAALSDGEITTKNSAGCLVSHPAIGIINSATMRLKAVINDLGLCPSSSKHSATIVPVNGPAKPADEEEWDGLLSITG